MTLKELEGFDRHAPDLSALDDATQLSDESFVELCHHPLAAVALMTGGRAGQMMVGFGIFRLLGIYFRHLDLLTTPRRTSVLMAIGDVLTPEERQRHWTCLRGALGQLDSDLYARLPLESPYDERALEAWRAFSAWMLGTCGSGVSFMDSGTSATALNLYLSARLPAVEIAAKLTAAMLYLRRALGHPVVVERDAPWPFLRPDSCLG
jgi:hypothetical protein